MRKKRTPALRNITRFEHKRTFGWWVRFLRDGTVHSKFFADAGWGGKKTALLAAKSHRDWMAEQLPAPQIGPTSASAGRIFKDRRRYRDRRTGRLKGYDCWCAWIRVAPGKVAATSYAIGRYGAEAKRMALAWLEKKRREQRKNYAAK